ncbi:MAG: DUF1343 domain-containing protein, partial [Lachnospiraceae bacterium]|nr:DUF1343 domain-containing protein [Lachnospiraceae bacterium]
RAGPADGAAVENSEHPKYHIPVVSLYGKKVHPEPSDFEGIDLLVYDIQDVGLRYYTYIYTLANCMQTAAECGIEFVVLDRPNPLGDQVAGGRIRPEYDSFVGAHGLPIRYGLTVGELGAYFKNYLHLNLSYRVIPMEGYRRKMRWPDTGQLWNLPSPAIHTFQTILCYCGGCFFEATNISEGRGTAEPFQIYGAPFIDMDALVQELKRRISDENLAFRKRAFVPNTSKYKGETCYGVEFLPRSDRLDFLPTALITMKTIREMYPEEFAFASYADVSRLSRLTGDDRVNAYLDDQIALDELLEAWKCESTVFERETEDLRLYS